MHQGRGGAIILLGPGTRDDGVIERTCIIDYRRIHGQSQADRRTHRSSSHLDKEEVVTVLHLFDLTGQVAIVTGAARGLGRQSALALAEAGADVAISSRKREPCEEVAKEVEQRGARSMVVPCHVGKSADIENLIDTVQKTWGRIDILVNNAATNPAMGALLNCEDSVWDKIMEVNLRSVFIASRKVAGIISGANGLKPGMVMKAEGEELMAGEHPVALTGRVWCWCDASPSPIQPGDLLTTSDTTGHAMKVVDHARAPGAVIGKAMTALEDGRGLVLVLVSLQ